MKFNNLVISVGLAFLTTITLHYFFGSKPQIDQQLATQSGQKFIAPKEVEVEINKPLNLEVDFFDEYSRQIPVVTNLETEYARYSFSTEAASLKHAEFKKNWGGQAGYLSTIFPPSNVEKERLCFLVALNKKTPYHFTLLDKQESNETFKLTYKSDFDGGFLYKIFTIYKHTYQIDLTITLEPKNANESWQPRIFFANPIVPELEKNDTVSGIVNDAKNSVIINQKTEETLSTYWSKPTLFGAQDRYFVHALVNDNNQFAQRAYYKIFDLESLYSIIEGPSVLEKTTWTVSFYIGPKTDEAMRTVDERLIQTLNYGFLAPISRPVSKILLKALNAIYDYCKNYGVAIIILTILMKLFLVLFTFKDGKNLKKRSEFNKKLKHLEEKYKHDKTAFNAARAELITKNGLPGLSGCLPLLIQMPLFLALSLVVSNSIELYKASFLWIPDLTAADPYFILPVLTALAMLLHAPIQEDPKQSMNSIIIALVLGAFTANLAAGVALYFLVNTAFTVMQTTITKRFIQ